MVRSNRAGTKRSIRLQQQHEHSSSVKKSDPSHVKKTKSQKDNHPSDAKKTKKSKKENHPSDVKKVKSQKESHPSDLKKTKSQKEQGFNRRKQPTRKCRLHNDTTIAKEKLDKNTEKSSCDSLQSISSRTNRLDNSSDFSNSSNMNEKCEPLPRCSEYPKTIKIKNAKPLMPPSPPFGQQDPSTKSTKHTAKTPANGRTKMKSVKTKTRSGSSGLPYNIKKRQKKAQLSDERIVAETKLLSENMSLCTSILKKSKVKPSPEVPKSHTQDAMNPSKILNYNKLAQLEKDMKMLECDISPIKQRPMSKKRKTAKFNTSLLRTPVRNVFKKLPKTPNTSLFEDSSEDEAAAPNNPYEETEKTRNEDNTGYDFYPLTKENVMFSEKKLKIPKLNSRQSPIKVGEQTVLIPCQNYVDNDLFFWISKRINHCDHNATYK